MVNHCWVILLVLVLIALQATAAVAAPAQTPSRFFLIDNGKVTAEEMKLAKANWDPSLNGLLTGWDHGPITIVVMAEPGKKYVFVPSFAEYHWNNPDERVVAVVIDGKHKGDVDIAGQAGKQAVPCAAQFVAEDTDGDGLIKFEITPAQKSPDKNCTMAALWVFEDNGKPVDLNAVMEGKLNNKAYLIADHKNLVKPSKKRMDSIGDARLCIGNGHWLACFVGPIEEPEEPIYQVHDKISRLWLGYANSQLGNIGMAPRIKDLKSGKEWVVGACDNYKFVNGTIIMDTEIEPGTVRTETYGLWDKPVMVRRISFTPKKGVTGDFQISTETSLYKGSVKKTTMEQLKLDWSAYAWDDRERPPFLKFPQREELKLSRADASAEWIYDSPYHRKVAICAEEPKSQIEIIGQSGKSNAVFEGENSGALRFSKKCGSEGGTLTVVLAFDKQLDNAKQLLAESKGKTAIKDVQKAWDDWFESGAVIHTNNKKLDEAYRVQAMYWKIAQDVEFGGIIVGGRYHMTTVWARDGGVAISSMLDGGHFEEAKKALRFFSKYAYWNERNACINANYHPSGRVMEFMCAPGQPPVEEILQEREWFNQMLGPQLDGMGYYLCNIGKYYRATGDKEFIKESWPFIIKVADSLAADNYNLSESGPQTGYTDKLLRFKKYNPDTGLIVDNCCEGGTFYEMMITSALASEGFRQASILAEVMDGAVPYWNQRADELDASIQKACYRKDDKGEYFVERPERPWINNGDTSYMGSGGFAWMIASTVQYYNYTDPIFTSTLRRFVDPNGQVGGWGMWFATTAHAAFEADEAELGWHYLKQVVEQLPESMQIFEHNQDVTGADGTTRRVTLNLFGYSYLPHAVIRGFAGLGYNEKERHYYLRPQIPAELGTVTSKIRIRNATFDITASGNGGQIEEFKIDGVDQTNGSILDDKYINGGNHTVVIKMKKV